MYIATTCGLTEFRLIQYISKPITEFHCVQYISKLITVNLSHDAEKQCVREQQEAKTDDFSLTSHKRTRHNCMHSFLSAISLSVFSLVDPPKHIKYIRQI